MQSVAPQLRAGLEQLNLTHAMNTKQLIADPLLQYAEAMLHWNKAFNLTAITQPNEVISHHLLDSLSASPHLHGKRILDVGTGAGLPGIPLAIANPDTHFTLLDSNNKRIRFLRQVCGQLGLQNVTPIHSRIEDCPERGFDSIISRAFTSLENFISSTSDYLAKGGQILAMKGQPTAEEIASLPNGWIMTRNISLAVPELQAQRCILICQRLG